MTAFIFINVNPISVSVTTDHSSSMTSPDVHTRMGMTSHLVGQLFPTVRWYRTLFWRWVRRHIPQWYHCWKCVGGDPLSCLRPLSSWSRSSGWYMVHSSVQWPLVSNRYRTCPEDISDSRQNSFYYIRHNAFLTSRIQYWLRYFLSLV